MSIGEVCNRNVVVVRRAESVRTAVRLMRERHVGDVVVVEDRGGTTIPVGIVTDRDILIGVVAPDVDIEALSVNDVMGDALHVVRQDDAIADALRTMRDRGVRRAPVVASNGALVGIVTVDDMIELLAEQMNDLALLIDREQQQERVRRVPSKSPV